ncbi:hydrogenase assembly protein HupF [Photobacterium angustum]|uniref:Hydrogenase expression/formation protein HypE n=1 Tax=Photobacterium angustum TaxID=661 RepID=A0ABX5GYK3_PHOAN|nr:hydrogenase expression/formation protein HypE [Photobacterium angustum]KJG40650.1 hydrogenase assembly protein HupF [Photobacterium angustum]PSX01995.1 hydrogenase expression/formation protein HypE [Photobacterium angustum]
MTDIDLTTLSTTKSIQLSHGGGGQEMNKLIKGLFFKSFDNDILRNEEDAAVLTLEGNTAFTTDSFTVSPLFFAGGNIGKLAIAGTVNDLAMMGAKPQYLSCSVIIEEGFDVANLKTIVDSMANELSISGAKIVCGDTKVVPKGCADGLFINTTGVGTITKSGISVRNLKQGDAIIVSRDIGRHGAAILMAREGLTLESELISDCNTLWPAVEALIAADLDIHAMRDATRGGLSAVLNEWAQASDIGINVVEDDVPVSEEVRGLCELYGFEPFDLANEGTFIIALPQEQAEKALEVLSAFAACGDAAIIGEVSDDYAGRVILTSGWGSRRYLDLPQGELLPRIC